MRSVLEKQIYFRCPTLFRQRINTNSRLRLGIACGDGWYDLIFDLASELEDDAREKKRVGVDNDKIPAAYAVFQETGALRFICDGLTSKQKERVSKAVKLSHETCEICGKPGRTIYSLFIRTRCRKCEY